MDKNKVSYFQQAALVHQHHQHLLLVPQPTAVAAAVCDENECFDIHTLLALAASGIVGVLVKYALAMALSAEVAAPLKELPANMVGCFFMGLLAKSTTVDKAATSLVGSITSFSLWNHALVSAAYTGKWSFALCSLLVGLELGFMSYKVGVDAADVLFGAWKPWKNKLRSNSKSLLSCLLWITTSVLSVVDTQRRQLWMACTFAPQGVWIRYLLSNKLNPKHAVGHPVGFPLGTWTSNLVSSGLQTVLQLIRIMNPTTSSVVDAFQDGVLDSMSTLSTPIAETHAFHRDDSTVFQAYTYISSTMASTLLLAGAVYLLPLTTRSGPSAAK